MPSFKTESGFRQFKLTVVLLISGLIAGCGPSPVKAVPAQVDGEDAVPSFPPTLKEMHEATAPGYKSPLGVKQECLGRLVFDVAQSVQWPTFHKGYSDGLFNRSFSKNVWDAGDEMRFGNTLVAVIGSVGGILKESVLESTPAATEARLKTLIKEERAYMAGLRKEGAKTETVLTHLERAEDAIRSWEKTLKDSQENFEPFNPGLPDSEGYWTSWTEASDETNRYSVLRAYLTRGDFIYVFESRSKLIKPADKEDHKKSFAAMLSKFRTRAPNEIPTELGVCVPFGFIPDDGKTVTEFKQSLRFPDAPGVLYTIQTGNVHSRRIKFTPLLAASRASTNPRASSEQDQIKPVVTQRIGPRLYKIGALTGSQGGVVLKVTQPSREKYDMYSVFTGYSGWLGTAVLPYILVDMRTVTKAQAAELKQNPPPFKPSMDRLDLLLKSMRLRPTNPPMPELANR